MMRPVIPLVLLLSLPALADAASRRPNVIFLFADDMRADSIAALGNPAVKTPHLDALVRRGFSFRNAYCLGGNVGAVCTPSRNMLLSGNAYFRWKDFTPPGGRGRKGLLAPGEGPNFPLSMKDAGYFTYHHGKRGNTAPLIQAKFDVNRYLSNDMAERRSGEPGKEIIDDAIAFLKAHKGDRPFFLYLAFANPHDPRVAARKYLDQYDRARLPLPANFLPVHPFDNGAMAIRDEKLSPWPRTAAEIRRTLHEYYATITALDTHIGRLFQTLEERKLTGDTLILFSADQGIAVGSHGLLGKQSLYDAAMKVPLVLAGPGIRKGTSEALVYLFDVYPSVCDLVGARVPTKIDGQSFKPILEGKATTARKELLLSYTDVQRALRDDRWKLIRYPQVDVTQLFDLRKDPDEKHDLSVHPAQKDRVRTMLARLVNLQKRFGDDQPLTVKNPKPAKWTPPGGATTTKPNLVLILADDLGYSDLGCYGSEIATPNLDRLAGQGVRFTQFTNAARCCPTRAALLTGLSPHQAGVGHMLQPWKPPSYTSGLGENTLTLAEALQPAGYRCYHVGKWHVGGLGKADPRNHPMNRGFDRAFGSGGGGNYFALRPLYLDHKAVEPDADFYATDAFSAHAERFLLEHAREHPGKPFFLHLCYTAPHFPLHARPRDIDRYRGKYRGGWDALRGERFARQKRLGLMGKEVRLPPRDAVAKAWSDVPKADQAEWDLRMAVHAAMIDRMDQGIGRVLEALRRTGTEKNTVVLFLSDNGASAEALDTWPNPARGHKPGSAVGTKESHRCLEVGWANAANTPFREHKMWVHEGGIATPLIVSWPAGLEGKGRISQEVGHVIDLMPTFLELAGTRYPKQHKGIALPALEGRSLVPVLRGKALGARTLAWEHEGNRAIRQGDWKLVASFGGAWELYDLARDRTETTNLANRMPERVKELARAWQTWADRVGVIPWERLPGAKYKPTASYRKKSEPVAP